MSEINVQEYLCEDGKSPFKQWFNSLDSAAAVKVATAIFRLKQGNFSSIKWLKGIGEYRIQWGPGYRIYLIQDGAELIILLGGGTKHRQQQDINKSRALAEDYWKRKEKP